MLHRPRWFASLLLLAGCAGPSDPEVDDQAWLEAAVVACAGGTTVKGVDVSFYQGNVNWNSVHASGVQYAVARVGDGYSHDPDFATNWAGIKNAGMIRGAYQFWRASDDQNRLADIVIAAVGHLGPGDLPVMFDIEDASFQGLSPAAVRSQMNIWLGRVEQGTGKRPIIYTGKYAWNPSVQSSGYGNYVLWVAAYGPNNGMPNQCPDTPMGWNAWNFWQYTSKGTVPGISGFVDTSMFNGSFAALQALANGGGGVVTTTGDNCTGVEASNCGGVGCACVDHACNGGFCPGPGCTAQHIANCGNYGAGCVDGQCNGGTAPGSGCTAKEMLNCGGVGCNCVDHHCAGAVACPGSACTWLEAHDCAQFGANCVDHQCSGGYGTGTGCTVKETNDCTAQGCGCVDHACQGGDQCAGSGSTARTTIDCGNVGCSTVDGKCSGGYCPGSGCTGKETSDCAAHGCGCVDGACSGGNGASCMGTGCTARQTLDCQALDAGCELGACTTPGGPTIVDAGQPQAPDDDGGTVIPDDAGFMVPPDDAGLLPYDAGAPDDDAGLGVGEGGGGEVGGGEGGGDAGGGTGGGEAGGAAGGTATHPMPDPKLHGGCSSAPVPFGLGVLLMLTLSRWRRPRFH